jgi:DNA-nicking Smr family endonuclease
MPRPPRGLSPEDEALWSLVARSVRPIRRRQPTVRSLEGAPKTPAAQAAPAPQKTPSPIAIPPRPSPPLSAPRITVHHAAPAIADRGHERRVRRGQVDISARLDLHGHTQDQAFAALTHTLFSTHAHGGGVALVVTGKGGRSGDGESTSGVLRRRLPDWLAAPGLRPIVAGFAPAHRRHGGAGAWYVFVRKRA